MESHNPIDILSYELIILKTDLQYMVHRGLTYKSQTLNHNDIHSTWRKAQKKQQQKEIHQDNEFYFW